MTLLESVDRAVALVTRCGYECAVIEQTDVDGLSGSRLVHPEGVSVDLLFASSGIEHEVVERSERLEIAAGLWLPVASVGDLIALKLLAVDEHRATDSSDLRGLSGFATDHDWAVAEEAVEQIEVRGFNRGRDLDAALAELSAV